MKLKDIIMQIPAKGRTCGMDIQKGSPEDWLDHALEKLVTQYIDEDNLFMEGLATAVYAMVVSMTLDKTDWGVIRSALEAVEYYF